MLTGAFQVSWCDTTIFEASLRKETVTLIDFVSQGVPEQAIILSVNYTGQGELLPIQIHSNVPRYDPLNKEVAGMALHSAKICPMPASPLP